MNSSRTATAVWRWRIAGLDSLQLIYLKSADKLLQLKGFAQSMAQSKLVLTVWILEVWAGKNENRHRL
ncbi:hypothetical protein [uncultured Pontibacter sp.]|uniref:hypothetical protein n=1 Tax=uncultured Pontibacter sp. TaxID=453356 RepID=UPI00262EBB08|nr:hypothetical protein [uncultured Pontibacter sp.]